MNPALLTQPEYETVELRIPAKAEWVAVARLAVAAVARRLPFSLEEIEDIKLATAEACTNCIESDSEGTEIEITSRLDEDAVHVSVRDRGVTRMPESTAGDGTFQDGNRTEELGIFLIRALMDDVVCRVDAREGTEIAMTKRVSR